MTHSSPVSSNSPSSPAWYPALIHSFIVEPQTLLHQFLLSRELQAECGSVYLEGMHAQSQSPRLSERNMTYLKNPDFECDVPGGEFGAKLVYGLRSFAERWASKGAGEAE
jgi:hypothetical protein